MIVSSELAELWVTLSLLPSKIISIINDRLHTWYVDVNVTGLCLLIGWKERERESERAREREREREREGG